MADVFELVYAPSLAVLHRCAARRRSRPEKLLLAENPTGDLKFTEVEGAVLRHLYPQKGALPGSKASKKAIKDAGRECHILHYAGHAYFDLNDQWRHL